MVADPGNTELLIGVVGPTLLSGSGYMHRYQSAGEHKAIFPSNTQSLEAPMPMHQVTAKCMVSDIMANGFVQLNY